LIVPAGSYTLYLQFGSNLDDFKGEDTFRLPMPTRYVLDQHSVIRGADVNPDCTVRPEPSETVRILEQLRGKS
jgi:hypothetical protein